MNSSTIIQNLAYKKWLLEKFESMKSTVIPRSIIVALIIGRVLNLINQFDSLFSSKSIQILPLLLMYLTPFVVVLYSQRTALKSVWQDINNEQTSGTVNGLLLTAFSHGIPAKALAAGLIIGFTNTSILAFDGYVQSGLLSAPPPTQMAQLFLMPIIFGILSQALSYRRAISLLTNPQP